MHPIKLCLICKDEVAPIGKVSSSPENSSEINAASLLDLICGDLILSGDENEVEKISADSKKVSLFCMACMEHAQEWREFKDEAKRLLRKGQEVKSTVISLIIQSGLEIQDNEDDAANSSHLPENFRKILKDFAQMRKEVAREYNVDPDVDIQEQVLSKLKSDSSRLNALGRSNGVKNNGTVVKRGRGRPRLNTPKEEAKSPKKAGRPRGRPRKRSRDSFDNSSLERERTPERVSKRIKVSPKKFSTSFLFQKSEYAKSGKRGRGRPPKQKFYEEDGDEEEEQNESSIDEIQDSTNEGHERDSPKKVGTPVKKGRGRPKKNSSVTPTPTSSKSIEKVGNDLENDQEPKKRGRGRPPKKNSLFESSQVSNKKPLANGSPGAPAKRPRGRPKKSTSSSGKSNGAGSSDVLESSQSQEEVSQSDTDKLESGEDDQETALIIEVNDEETNGATNEEDKEDGHD